VKMAADQTFLTSAKIKMRSFSDKLFTNMRSARVRIRNLT